MDARPTTDKWPPLKHERYVGKWPPKWKTPPYKPGRRRKPRTREETWALYIEAMVAKHGSPEAWAAASDSWRAWSQERTLTRRESSEGFVRPRVTV
jgi:hypothetical protein